MGTTGGAGLSADDVYARQGIRRPLGIVEPTALLLVDFVNGFADPAVFGGGNIAAAVARSVDLLAEARRRGWPVAHTRIVFANDGADANVLSLKVSGLLTLTEDNPQSAITAELAPQPGGYIVRKTVPSAFSSTGLAAWLSAHGVRTLVVGGCTTSGCVRASVMDAMSLGFRPVVIADCVGDRALRSHEADLFDLAQKCGDVLGLADFIGRLPHIS